MLVPIMAYNWCLSVPWWLLEYPSEFTSYKDWSGEQEGNDGGISDGSGEEILAS